MLAIFRNNNYSTIGILFVIAIVFHLQSILHTPVPVVESHSFLFAFIFGIIGTLLGSVSVLYGILGFMLLFLQALYLNYIANRHKLFGDKHFYPALVFIMLTSMVPNFVSFNVYHLVNFCMIYMLDILLTVKSLQVANKQLFNVGFVMMLASLLHFSAVFLLLFLLIAVFIYRPANVKELLVLLFGMLMPIYILFGILFCVDQLELIQGWFNIGVTLPKDITHPYYFLVLILGILIWASISIFNMQSILTFSSTSYKRDWAIITLLLFMSIITSVFSDYKQPGSWLMTIPTLSLIFSFAFSNTRSVKMRTISFYFAFLIVIGIQLLLPK